MKRFLLLLFLLAPLAVSAAEQPAASGTVLGFADHLFEQKDYYRAITEYERFLFLDPQSPKARYARYRIARCYFEGDKLPTAVTRLRELAVEPLTDRIGRDAMHLLGEAHYLRRDYGKARKVFRDFLRLAADDRRADAVRIRIGWSYLREGNWRQAAEEFRTLPEGSALREEAEGLESGALGYPDIRHKSPTLAGWMSALLPGAGQLYVGRRRDAAVSFLLNGTFIWATAEQFRKDNHVTGGILLFFESGWYLGNIYNAVGGAHKYNRRAENGYLDGLERRYGVAYSRDEEGTHRLAFTLRF